MTLPVTVVIPAKNEARNLPVALAALGGHFASVVVVDSGSTDETVQIAQAAGAVVLKFQWNGRFPKKRNWVLRNYAFKTSWVLFLDADECVTPEFIAEVKDAVFCDRYVGYWLTFENWFLGKRIRYGDPFRKLALFRVSAGEYERFPEQMWSGLDMEVHEHPVLNGLVGEVHSPIEHRDYRGLHHYIAKHNEYSTWEANRFGWLSQASAENWQSLTKRQRFKYRNLDKWWLGSFYFLVSYVLKRGFLDGRAGFVFNCMKARYFADIRLKIREAKQGVTGDG